MAFKRGSTAYGSTGVKTLTTTGFTPIGLRITICLPGTGNNYIAQSVGSTDGTTQTCAYIYDDGTTIDSGDSITKLGSLRDDLGAGLAEQVAITFNSFNAGNAKINVNTANANYNIDWEAWS